MMTFKSNADLNQLDTGDPVSPVMKELVELLIDAYWTSHTLIDTVIV
jgi:hypothetical protein